MGERGEPEAWHWGGLLESGVAGCGGIVLRGGRTVSSGWREDSLDGAFGGRVMGGCSSMGLVGMEVGMAMAEEARMRERPRVGMTGRRICERWKVRRTR